MKAPRLLVDRVLRGVGVDASWQCEAVFGREREILVCDLLDAGYTLDDFSKLVLHVSVEVNIFLR
jgi:hypothetical protein